MDLYATGGEPGQLVLQWDFTRVLPMFETLCVSSAGQCFYSTINPAFLTGEDAGSAGLRVLEQGSVITVEIIDLDPGLTLNVNGVRLSAAGARTEIGVAPFHVHPAWQAIVPVEATGEVTFRYRLVSADGRYLPSPVYVQRFVLTRSEPEPTPTPKTFDCTGDCNADGEVTIDEIVRAVQLALGLDGSRCDAVDSNHDGEITIDEIVLAVQMALQGCPGGETVSWTTLHEEFFLPRCAVAGCHSARDRVANLDLEHQAYENLVNVAPQNPAAAANGWLRIVPGDPLRSFLYRKLQPIGPEFGSQMPLGGAMIEDDWLARLYRWIRDGARNEP
jgi:hypothetical protein